ncbi:MAG: type III-B CRISPR-associated protein Cas10/Cmr2 [Anaerolineae bacterium]|nr:type III-B CRISPR-associated protein Cas10/Cmr2 [Anaerolineae bacterium]
MNAKGTPQALLLFTIGPVQDFIAAARRTQDLWMGSYVLAYLSYEAMAAIREAAGYNPEQPEEQPDPILFPALDEHPFTKGAAQSREQRRLLTLATLPNKFTAQVASIEQGQAWARLAHCRVIEKWQEIAAAVEGKVPGSLVPGVDWKGWQETWKKQIAPESWLELYWIVYPNSTPPVSFGELNKRAEQALAARKGLRDFTAATERGERDSITGRRAALSSPAQQPRRDLRQQWQKLGEALHREGINKSSDYSGLSAALSTQGHEYLSAIDATKRFAQRFFFDPHWGLRGAFPSTSSIASAVFRQKLLNTPAMKNACDEFVDNLRKIKGDNGEKIPETLAQDGLPRLYTDFGKHPLLEYDGDLFYPDTYTDKRLKDDYNITFSQDAVVKLSRNVSVLRDTAKKQKIALPPTYYGLLVMDGDRMGQKLAATKTVSEQRRISQDLMKFALGQVQLIVEDQYLGRVVYAGGDDLMAFLPLEHVLDAADALNQVFREATGFEASAGVAIAHHLAPLDRVLQVAREAEKLAKGRYGRNSIVFSVLKRSGEQLDVGTHWDYKELSILPIVRQVRDYMQDEAIALSARFAFDADREAQALTNLEKKAHEKRLTVLLHRHSKNLAEADRHLLAGNLAQIAAGLQSQLRRNVERDETEARNNPRSGTVELARWLLLARFLVAAAAGED